jgi:hypothetical protein
MIMHGHGSQARNEHLNTPARVEDSHLQFLAIYGDTEVVNKVIAKGNQETSSIETKSAIPRDRCAPLASTTKVNVEPGTKPTVKYKINNTFCVHATSIHEKEGPSILHERPPKVEEEDALKFVTPQKRSKNKKPTTFNDDFVMPSPLLSHFQPNVSDEYSTEEFSHPTALNYCQQPSMFSTVMGVASLQIQARVLSTIVFSGSVLLQFSAKNHQPAFSCGIPFEISHDLVLTVSSLFSQSILENPDLIVPQDLNVMAPVSLMQRPLLYMEHCMNFSLVEPTSS